MSYGKFLWELEPKIVLSAKMKKKCCIVADIMAWKIGYFIAGNVWLTLNQNMKKRINMVELGKARRVKFDWCKNNWKGLYVRSIDHHSGIDIIKINNQSTIFFFTFILFLPLVAPIQSTFNRCSHKLAFLELLFNSNQTWVLFIILLES